MAAALRRLSGCVAFSMLSGVASLFAAVALIGGCRHLPPPTPLDQLNAQQTHGHAVFQARCGQCHRDREEGSLHGPSLLGVYKLQYLPSGTPANDERVTSTVLHGHGLMPAQPNIDPQDLDDLVAYLHTL
jgi:mono/diheme cytochrome c family protein